MILFLRRRIPAIGGQAPSGGKYVALIILPAIRLIVSLGFFAFFVIVDDNREKVVSNY